MVPGTFAVFQHYVPQHMLHGDVSPMPTQDGHKRNLRVMLSWGASMLDAARPLDLAERSLRPADQLDYAVRRWLIPVPFEASRSVAVTSIWRWFSPLKRSQQVTRSMTHKEASIRSSGALSDVQVTIGRHLRAQYALERSMPARLANLLREFEQRNDKPEAFTRGGYASRA